MSLKFKVVFHALFFNIVSSVAFIIGDQFTIFIFVFSYKNVTVTGLGYIPKMFPARAGNHEIHNWEGSVFVLLSCEGLSAPSRAFMIYD